MRQDCQVLVLNSPDSHGFCGVKSLDGERVPLPGDLEMPSLSLGVPSPLMAKRQESVFLLQARSY